MRSTIYNLIATALADIVPHIDLWNEQVLYSETEQPFNLPAVFIEFTDINWTQQLHGVRDAEAEIRLHIVTDSRAGDWNDALGNLAIADTISNALHALHNQSGVDSLTLISTHTDHNFAELRDDVETYHCHVTYTPTANDTTATIRQVEATMK